MIEKKIKTYFAELNYSLDESQVVEGVTLTKGIPVEISKDLYEKFKNSPNKYVTATTFIGGMAISPKIERVVLTTKTVTEMVEDEKEEAEKEAVKSDFAADIGSKPAKPRGAKPKPEQALDKKEEVVLGEAKEPDLQSEEPVAQ